LTTGKQVVQSRFKIILDNTSTVEDHVKHH